MSESKYIVKIQEDTKLFLEDCSNLQKILDSWGSISAYDARNDLFNEITELTPHILSMYGKEMFGYDYLLKEDKQFVTYFEFCLGLDVNKLDYAELRRLHKLASMHTKSANAELFAVALTIRHKLNHRLSSIRKMEIVSISIGNHEDLDSKETYIYCTMDRDTLKKAYKEGSIKFSFDFLSIVRNEDEFQESELAELVALGYDPNEYEDSGISIETIVYTYMFIAGLAKSVDQKLDYCLLGNQHHIEIYTHKFCN